MHMLKEKQQQWSELPFPEKAALLKEIRLRLLEVAEDWALQTSVVKGKEHDPGFAPLELIGTCTVLASFLRRLEDVLNYAGRYGRIPANSISHRQNKQLAAKVRPPSPQRGRGQKKGKLTRLPSFPELI